MKADESANQRNTLNNGDHSGEIKAGRPLNDVDPASQEPDGGNDSKSLAGNEKPQKSYEQVLFERDMLRKAWNAFTISGAFGNTPTKDKNSIHR